MDISPAPTLLHSLHISDEGAPPRAPQFLPIHAQSGPIPASTSSYPFLKNLFHSARSTHAPDPPRSAQISYPVDAIILPAPANTTNNLRHHAFEFTATVEGVGSSTANGLGTAWVEKPRSSSRSDMPPPPSRLSSMYVLSLFLGFVERVSKSNPNRLKLGLVGPK